MLSTLGFTAVAFVTGSLALWAPTFLYRAAVFTGKQEPCLKGNCAASERSRTLRKSLHPDRLAAAST